MALLLDTDGRLRKRREPRRLPPYFRTKKLAIVGCTSSHVHAPYFDQTWTVACHCGLEKELPHRYSPDWWFDLHPRACFTKVKGWNPTYYKWLRYLRTPIFMQEDWPDIPMAVRYPKERILAEFQPYFTNHTAWMIALAMTEGVTHLGLFGCDYKHEDERSKQRGSCEYWMGRFQERGGQLVLPPGCSLLHDPKELYGYQSHDEKGKLVASYRQLAKPGVIATHPKDLAPQDMGDLVVVDPNSHERMPLCQPPPGITLAWERSGYTIHA